MSDHSGSEAVQALVAVDAVVHEVAGDAVRAHQTAVRVPSVSPRIDPDSPGEQACAELLADIATQLGLEVDLWSVAPGRSNLAAWGPGSGVINGGPARRLLLGGHTDVAPPGASANWSGRDPFSGRVANNRVRGRGARNQSV
jgi:acetylornithine deacetylase/succinyl-diaminopimelate desuccinylase-like protein